MLSTIFKKQKPGKIRSKSTDTEVQAITQEEVKELMRKKLQEMMDTRKINLIFEQQYKIFKKFEHEAQLEEALNPTPV